MTADNVVLNVFPETQPLIDNARSLPDRPYTDRMVDVQNIGELMLNQCAKYGDKNWLTFLEDGERTATYTYSEFEQVVRQTAGFMTRGLGIQQGDRIATLTVNDFRVPIIYYAAWSIGATVVPVNCGEDDDRVEFILANSNVKALFSANDQLERVGTISSKLPFDLAIVSLGDIADDSIHFDESVANSIPLVEFPLVPIDSEALIVYTSGTTGAPKGVALDQYNLLVDAKSITDWHNFTDVDRAMCVLPIHHVNGTVVTIVTPMYHGGSLVLNRRFRAHGFWKNLSEEACTWVSVVPTVLAFLCEISTDLSTYDLTKFRHIICGAGPLTVELARRFDRLFGVRVVHGYGLSETTCYSCFLPIDLDAASYQHWMFECGFPSIGCEISANLMEIQDEHGKTLGADERGEIVIRGHNVMRYYFGRPEVNKETFANGWFRSGDEGFYRLGADGKNYFFITGRLKELIIRGGVNYSPFDIDEVLVRIPGIKAAMAVGFDNSFYGEEIGAYVQLESGATVTGDEIMQVCKAELGYNKCPKVVIFGEDFPVTSTGKYQRNKLKPLFREYLTTQFRDTKRR